MKPDYRHLEAIKCRSVEVEKTIDNAEVHLGTCMN